MHADFCAAQFTSECITCCVKLSKEIISFLAPMLFVSFILQVYKIINNLYVYLYFRAVMTDVQRLNENERHNSRSFFSSCYRPCQLLDVQF